MAPELKKGEHFLATCPFSATHFMRVPSSDQNKPTSSKAYITSDVISKYRERSSSLL